MAAKELGKKLMKATNEGSDHNKSLAKALGDYLTANTQVIISYTGIIPGTPPVTDPVIADTLQISGDISGFSSVDFNTWLLSIETGVILLKLEKPGLIGLKPTGPLPIFKTGLTRFLTQKDLYDAHLNPSNPMYSWEEIDATDEIRKEAKEVEKLSNLPTDKFFSNYAKIKHKDKDGKEYYKYYESIYAACEAIWIKISEKIIEWIENNGSHFVSFPASNSKSGSNGTATIVSIKVL